MTNIKPPSIGHYDCHKEPYGECSAGRIGGKVSTLDRLHAYAHWVKKEKSPSEDRLLMAQDIEKILQVYDCAFQVNRLHSVGGTATQKVMWITLLSERLQEVEDERS